VTRAVVIGPFPPTADPRGDAVLADVRARRGAGVEVDVVSPYPSAAKYHARPDSVTGAIRIARATRGADVVVVYPFHARHGVAATLAPHVLGRALARAGRVEHVAGVDAGPVPPRRPTVAMAVRRLGAGLPTFVRTRRRVRLRRRR